MVARGFAPAHFCREPIASLRAKGPWGGPCKGGPPFATGAKFREERRTRDGNHSVSLIRLPEMCPNSHNGE